ncbi:unnamed protein product [Acanthoscelides obtectus]|uniref:DDE Tnp4 domain-containing protein n=1 Tax=Acanthoscelides obtectus TaxID=200917 RepID=A0A9P0PB42_ACAOB|nr:unnamed protein product [Acanthoscelides obtectus]CAK1621075.1 hypothetical protein AOBTE_LOCUS747 [Acanthoscelides obtectus]
MTTGAYQVKELEEVLEEERNPEKKIWYREWLTRGESQGASTNLIREVPDTHDAWKKGANGFEARSNFPFCCGAIDGKNVLIEAPPHTGSEYFNCKGSFSVVLMAIVDHNYCFSYFKVGTAKFQDL